MEDARKVREPLKSKCPSCGREHTAPTLDKLVGLIRACCKQQSSGRLAAQPQAQPTAPLTLPVELRFDRQVLSQNQTSYAHWSRHHKDKKDWISRVSTIGRTLVGRRFGYSRWRLVRRYCPPKREYDHANLVGGAKPLIDCLVDCGIIPDDKPAHFFCDYDQEPGDRDETLLILEEVADEHPAA